MDSNQERGRLTFTVNNGDVFVVGNAIIQVTRMSGNQLKVRVMAPKSMRISRHAEGKPIQQKSTDTA